MSTAQTEPTLRQRIEGILENHPGRGVALTRIYELLPDAETGHVRLTIKNLMKRGSVIRHGTMRYPAYQLVREGDPLHRPATAAPVELVQAINRKPPADRGRVKATTEVTWPADVRVQLYPPPTRKAEPFGGIDWDKSVQRPGCQDHLMVPSRRGELRVMHQGPLSIRGVVRKG